MTEFELLSKYNVPVPRYTSYPTVPYWSGQIKPADWIDHFRQQFSQTNATQGISLYLHLPFCESLCTYCGCNKKITRNHGVEAGYLEAIRKEWLMYLELMDGRPLIREVHLGGGTPTFFSPENLSSLLGFIFSQSDLHPQSQFSFEGHPNNTTTSHLQTLFDLGFRRVSFGVQDNDPEVQRLINRIQPFENVVRVTEEARRLGYESVNFDLIYGLPGQHAEGLERTIRQCATLKPDRVAFYSYAHVPWTSRGQRLFDERDLPEAGEKLRLYQKGTALFLEHGYQDIGMDHFALANDELALAWKAGTLHRNFMGYTTQHSGLLLGLGVSSISDSGNGYAQNVKTIHEYYARIEQHQLPVEKGYFLREEDLVFKRHILDIMCRGKTIFSPAYSELLHEHVFPRLEAMQADQLLIFDEHRLELTTRGRNFMRNVCSAFDLHLARKQMAARHPLFSQAV